MTNAAPSSPPEPPSRDELLCRAFIEAGYRAPDQRSGLLRDASYWLANNAGLLRLSLGRAAAAKRAALSPARRRDEFHALMFLQAADLLVVTQAMRNFVRRLDVIGYDEAFEEFIVYAVEPSLATLPADADAALIAQLTQMAETSASLVEGSPPPSDAKSNRPDDPNRSGQAGSPVA